MRRGLVRHWKCCIAVVPCEKDMNSSVVSFVFGYSGIGCLCRVLGLAAHFQHSDCVNAQMKI